MYKLLYCNLNRSRDALDLMKKTAYDLKADILLCSEPNKIRIQHSQWYTDDQRDVGISVGPGTRIMKTGKGNGYVWVQLESCTLFSCYISPNATETRFNEFLSDLQSAVRMTSKVIIVGDFNAKNSVWGSQRTDKRGKAIVEWAASELLTIHNDGIKPTFRRGKQESYIDLTLSTTDLAPTIQNWSVEDGIESLSDHNYISMVVNMAHTNTSAPRRTKLRFKIEKAEVFRSELLNVLAHKLLSPEEYIDTVQSIADSNFRTRPPRNRKQVNWWCDEVKTARAECVMAKRRLARSKRICDPSQLKMLTHDYKVTRNALKASIRQAKETAFQKLLEEVNSDPWGDAYRLVAKRTQSLPALSDEAQIRHAKELFPSVPRIRWETKPQSEDTTPFCMNELLAAASRLKSGKAPGPDGLTTEMVQLAILTDPFACLAAMNNCLANGRFPNNWKKAELRLLPKPRKPGQLQVKYRPICLLSVFGKVFERMLVNRIMPVARSKISPRQHGFTPGQSTADAIKEVTDLGLNAKKNGEIAIMITLDIKNAFNAAQWTQVIAGLARIGIPNCIINVIQSYFSNRVLLVGSKSLNLSCGVPQGSVLGPLLWNIMYDAVVGLRIPNAHIVAYADDLAIIVVGADKDELLLNTELALKVVAKAMRDLSIEIAPEKTEATVLAAPSRLSASDLTFSISGHDITAGNNTKYLGVWLERNGSCRKHVAELQKAAESRVHALSRLTNIRCPTRQKVRRMYGEVIYSGLLYAAPAWASLVKTRRDQRRLASASRSALLRVSSAHPTSSTPAAEVVAGIPPIMLRLRERAVVASETYDRRTAMQNTRNEWQRQWEEESRGRWTWRLIPSIGKWVDRRHGEVDRFICQLLTGHGVSREKRFSMGLGLNDRCPDCNEKDTAEHIFFECKEHAGLRVDVENAIGEKLTPDRCVEVMLASIEGWEAVARMARCIVLRRESVEGLRRTLHC